MTQKRFLIVPDSVHSVSDGQRHWISGGRLIELYGLNPDECVVWREHTDEELMRGLLRLSVLSHGDYKEHLERAKVADWSEYYRARKLFVHNTEMKRDHFLPSLQRRIDRHERVWPDFPKAYARQEKGK